MNSSHINKDILQLMANLMDSQKQHIPNGGLLMDLHEAQAIKENTLT